MFLPHTLLMGNIKHISTLSPEANTGSKMVALKSSVALIMTLSKEAKISFLLDLSLTVGTTVVRWECIGAATTLLPMLTHRAGRRVLKQVVCTTQV